jgi:hypothetical protein
VKFCQLLTKKTPSATFTKDVFGKLSKNLPYFLEKKEKKEFIIFKH